MTTLHHLPSIPSLQLGPIASISGWCFLDTFSASRAPLDLLHQRRYPGAMDFTSKDLSSGLLEPLSNRAWGC